jgi:methanogenic corrinoid protein MtbC1
VHSLVERKADVLAVSATMGCHLHAVQDLVETVRAEPRCAFLHVMVGGYPFTVDPALWRAVGADGAAADADAAVALAEQWEAGEKPA